MIVRGFGSRSLFLLAIVLVAALGLAACGEGDDGGEAPAPTGGETISMYDGQWESLWINNEIAKFIIEEGFGHSVDIQQISTPILQETMPEGEIDIAMELWCVNIQEWCDRVYDEGSVLELSEMFEDSSQGWFVPRYVIEGDEERDIEPVAEGLSHVNDLPDYTDVFADPEDPDKGLILTGITGWEITELNEAKLFAYELEDHYNTQQAGSVSALDAAIAGAYRAGEPVLAYYWTPSWILGEFDMVLLDEPDPDPACSERLAQAADGEIDMADLGGEDDQCAYPGGAIHKGVTASLQDRAPEVVDLLDAMTIGNEILNEVAAWMELEGAEPDAAALYFFETYDIWRDWIDGDVEDRVVQALQDAGADV